MIAYCITDLLFATRIKSTAASLGVEAKAARTPGRLAELLAAETDIQAVLIDLDLDGDPLEFIRAAKSAGEGPDGLEREGVGVDVDADEHNGHREAPSAGAACRVIAFGPHVDRDRLRAARDAGADEVMPRSRFVQELPAILGGEDA